MQTNVQLENLEEYLEKLYEHDVKEQVKGSFMIMQLARNPEYLDKLITNDTLLGALSRVLKEEGKYSMELVMNILYVFYSFSHFSQFHELIERYDVGSIVMKTIEYEHRRYMEIMKSLNHPKTNKMREKKLYAMLAKQEKLLFVCFHILLNLAEDISVELKMKKKNIIPYLANMLMRDNVDLLVLTVTFLKKLSIFQENKNDMIKHKVFEKVKKFVNIKNEKLVNATLKLILNLSFDKGIRDKLTQIVPRVIKLLQKQSHHEVCVKLLYQVSCNETNLAHFAKTDVAALISEYIISYPQQQINTELLALAINLSNNAEAAKQMAANKGLMRLMEKLIKTNHSLLAKLIRNISQHKEIRPLFKQFVSSLFSLATKADSSDLLVELLGILGNMEFPEFSYEPYFKQFNLTTFLFHHLLPSRQVEDDIILEVIIVTGVVCSDAECAYMISKTNLVKAICDLFDDKQRDDEIALQILYVFYKFLSFESTRAIMMRQRHIIDALASLLRDKNEPIRKMADRSLDLVMRFNPGLAEELKLKKFEVYNEEWLNAVKEQGVDIDYCDESYDSINDSHNDVSHWDADD